MPDASTSRVQAPKPVSASRVTLAQLMGPQDANLQGNVHGGNIMKLMDEAGGSGAIRHAQRPAGTGAGDPGLFPHPRDVGDPVPCGVGVAQFGGGPMEVQLEMSE